jgi:predicted GNAT family N-acyltransferase
VRVAAVDADVVRPLRQAVLRPHQRLEDQVFPGDDLPGAAHFAAFGDDGAVVGVASISPEPHPRGPAPGDWRVRGMATTPSARGTGAGGRLLAACLDHARTHDARRVWCNARTPAVGFYERAGFTAEGDEFELPGIGPHFLMALDL